MKTRFSNNENLDLLGAELLKATALRDDEVERIASGDELFAGVRARIIADSVIRNKTSVRFTLIHKLAVASAAGAVVVAVIFAAAFISSRRGVPTANLAQADIPAPVIASKPAPSTDIFNDMDKTVSTVERAPKETSRSPQYVRAAEYQSAPARRSVSRSEPQNPEVSDEFYALADLHPSEEAARNGRIVRVELPRASLVALGVNVPLDSDKQMIKTDLLVGPDGVPRAIRIVE
jgi:hypothetical protein